MATQPSGDASTVRVLSCLNALFPSFVPLEGEDDIDPDPCTPGLRESIRLTVFHNLLEGDWTLPAQQKNLRMRLLEWCGVPQYSDARLALLRYGEITRKLEEVLSNILAEEEDREDPTQASPTTDLWTFSVGERTSTPDRSVISRASSRYSSDSSSGMPTGSFEASTCLDTHPLFKGIPGRELSASKTDGAAFAGDFDAPPVLSHPDDVTRDQWSQHPIAKSLALSSKEKAFLGLILPTDIADRDF